MTNFSSIFEIFFGLNLIWVISDSFSVMLIKNATSGYEEFLQRKNRLDNIKKRIDMQSSNEFIGEISKQVNILEEIFEKYNQFFFEDRIFRNTFNFVSFYNVLFCFTYLIFSGFNIDLDISKNALAQAFVLFSFAFLRVAYIFLGEFNNKLTNPFKATIVFVCIFFVSFAQSIFPNSFFYKYLISEFLFYILLISLPIFHFLIFYYRTYKNLKLLQSKDFDFTDYISSIEETLLKFETIQNNSGENIIKHERNSKK